MTISQRVDSLWRQMCLHEFPLSNVLWDRLKANISRMFRIYHILLLKLSYFSRKNYAK